MPETWRTIREEDDEVENAVNDLASRYGRFDDIWEMVTWKICRDPETKTSYRVRFSRKTAFVTKVGDERKNDVPTVRILYTYDEDYVYIHSVEEVVE